jgi:hypothetical protein
MNWNAISAVSEALGSIAVMISVVYLAVQIRKQTHESMLAATRELAAQFQDALKEVIDDADFAAIWLKAVQDYDGRPGAERIRIGLFLQRVCRIMEQQFLHTRRGHVDAAYFESLDLAFCELLTFPGTQRWWTLRIRNRIPRTRGRNDSGSGKARLPQQFQAINRRATRGMIGARHLCLERDCRELQSRVAWA